MRFAIKMEEILCKRKNVKCVIRERSTMEYIFLFIKVATAITALISLLGYL